MAGSPDLRGGLKNVVVQRVIGVVALVVAALVFAGFRGMLPFFHKAGANAPVAANQTLASPVRPAPQASAPAPAANAAPSQADGGVAIGPHPANNGMKHADASAPAKNNNVRLASTNGTGAPVVTAVTTDALKPNAQMAHLDEHLTYQYNALGRRDPFQSLVDGEFVGADVGGDAPPDPGGIKVVGIVWGATDQFAMVEDVRGNSYVLRKGDKVQNGVVTGLKRDAVVVQITADGQSQSVEIPLLRKGERNAR